MDIKCFMADVCDSIGGMGVWPSFVRHMKEKGYSEQDIEEGFEEVQRLNQEDD